MSPARGTWLAALLVLGAAGCKDDREPPAGRGVSARGASEQGATAEPEPSSPPPEPAGSPRRPSTLREPRSVRPAQPFAAAEEGSQRGTPKPPAEDPGSEAPERDLGAELHRVIGDPAPCLASVIVSELPDRVSITVRARISVTGVITRAEAHSSALPEEATRCVEAQAERAKLAGPIDGAPRTVSTSLQLERRKNDQ